ncbi:hypothetical protein NDU88_010525 [Pleurodeles waltl]|uniref:Uncharacterized protein n=1 Tax=Pleurodeles waltl TaxID=8319 RepID=A0AAV7Q0D9_PLEWA|nr:hypothetical protein NDU88_010525 [Pleurodeles waltl]
MCTRSDCVTTEEAQLCLLDTRPKAGCIAPSNPGRSAQLSCQLTKQQEWKKDPAKTQELRFLAITPCAHKRTTVSLRS